MGAAASTNSTKLVVNSLTDISTDIIKESIISHNQDIIINIEDVDNVNISNVDALQSVHIDVSSLYNSFLTEENSDKINQQIAQKAQSLISGLNLGQLGITTNLLSDVIENSIKIKNKTLETCKLNSKQDFTLKIHKSKNVDIKDLTIHQIAGVLFECVQNSNNETILKKETDNKIDQIAATKLEGLDPKWAMIALAAGGVGIFAVGSSSIKTLIGPICILGGVGACVFQYWNSSKSLTINKMIFINKPLGELYFNLHLLKSVNKDSSKLNFSDYGDATFYEEFNNKISLYSGEENFENFKSNLSTNDFSVSITEIKDPDPTKDIKKELLLKFKPGLKFTSVILTVQNKITDYKIFKELPIEKNAPEIPENFVVIETKDLFLGRLKFYMIQSKVPFLFSTQTLTPTIVGMKKKPDIMNDVIKKPIFIIGASCILLGILLTYMMNKSRK